MPILTDGRFSLIYPNGEYRTLQVKTMRKGNLKGSTILKIKEGQFFNAVGFLSADNRIRFWDRIKFSIPAERRDRIQRAVDRIVADPAQAGLAYAMQESRCFRCGKELTVPASIHNGMGPECARKDWTREDQKAAYNWRAGQKTADGALPIPPTEKPQRVLPFKLDPTKNY